MKNKARLEPKDWLEFPCKDLHTIDQLWVKYSDGRFGLSIQKTIWESIGGNLNGNYEIIKIFSDQVGWWEQGSFLCYRELTFNSKKARIGHLPVLVDDHMLGICEYWLEGCWEVVDRKYLFSRAKICNL